MVVRQRHEVIVGIPVDADLVWPGSINIVGEPIDGLGIFFVQVLCRGSGLLSCCGLGCGSSLLSGGGFLRRCGWFSCGLSTNQRSSSGSRCSSTTISHTAPHFNLKQIQPRRLLHIHRIIPIIHTFNHLPDNLRIPHCRMKVITLMIGTACNLRVKEILHRVGPPGHPGWVRVGGDASVDSLRLIRMPLGSKGCLGCWACRWEISQSLNWTLGREGGHALGRTQCQTTLGTVGITAFLTSVKEHRLSEGWIGPKLNRIIVTVGTLIMLIWIPIGITSSHRGWHVRG
mmetsp:Transcript_21614/g.46878  ORF Transcript_21614/g.46878 Transcript_21614/m.46878 type:complete len:286 (-) Transcript_21614:675-1532(-)